MNVVVIYKTKYSSTKEYAMELAKRLNCKAIDIKDVKVNELKQYDTIIFGSYLIAGYIKGIKFLTKNYDKLKDKNIMLFYLGLEDITEEKSYEVILKRNIPIIRDKIKSYYLKGRIRHDKLSLIHKMMMKIPITKMEKKYKQNPTEENKIAYEQIKSDMDFVDFDNLDKIINDLK